MNTNKHELLLKEEVLQIVGCAMEVLNTLGHGLLEKPYESELSYDYSCPFVSIRGSNSHSKDRNHE